MNWCNKNQPLYKLFKFDQFDQAQQFPQCSINMTTISIATMENDIGWSTLIDPIGICLPQQHQLLLTTCPLMTEMMKFNVSETILSENITIISPMIIVTLSINLLLFLFQFVITIPLYLLRWIIFAIFSRLYQTLIINLLVCPKMEAFLLIGFLSLLIVYIRSKMNFWKDKNIPYECLMAHLLYLPRLKCFQSHLIWSIDDDDVARVRRLGRIFG